MAGRKSVMDSQNLSSKISELSKSHPPLSKFDYFGAEFDPDGEVVLTFTTDYVIEEHLTDVAMLLMTLKSLNAEEKVQNFFWVPVTKTDESPYGHVVIYLCVYINTDKVYVWYRLDSVYHHAKI